MLLQEFDRLLFLAMGGKTLYFGEVGDSSKTITEYFERNGARPCGPDENPAEWMLEVTSTVSSSKNTQDWPAIWSDSEEHKAVKSELRRLSQALSPGSILIDDPDALRPFAASFGTQLRTVLVRVFQQYWRTPSYLYPKVALCLFSVSPSQPKTDFDSADHYPGNVHRLFLLEDAQFPPGTAKSAICRLHAPHNLLQFLLTDSAKFCHATGPLRSQRTSVQDLFLDGVYPVEYLG